MMARTRHRSRRGWPDNLYPNRDGFKYRHPITKRETWMGRDKARAFAAAQQLNTLLTKGTDLVARVNGGEKTVKDAINLFRQDDIPSRHWGERTASEYEIILRRVEIGLGPQPLSSLTVKECAEWLRVDTDSSRGRLTRRLVLKWILACAVQEGWIDTNPAEATRRFNHERQRDRLTIQAYNQIHMSSPQWLQNAMDLSLLTLLRREDITSARFSDVHDGALWIVPSKTEGSSHVKLRIALTPALDKLIKRCHDSIVSPYLIHRLPERAKPQNQRASARIHHTQVLPEQLTRAFQQMRERVGITGPTAPTFHEIRSLGGALLRTEAGWSEQQVQELMGHSSVSMTKHYLDGHEAPWQKVEPGLSLLK